MKTVFARLIALDALLAKLHTKVIAMVLAGLIAPYVAKLLGLHVTAQQLGGYFLAVGGVAATVQTLLSKRTAAKRLLTRFTKKGPCMATVAQFQVPSDVPSGQSGEIVVTFNTDPGTPATTSTIELKDPTGNVVQSGTLTLDGKPAEATPTVAVGDTPGEWCITASAGTLTAHPSTPNAFDISA